MQLNNYMISGFFVVSIKSNYNLKTYLVSCTLWIVIMTYPRKICIRKNISPPEISLFQIRLSYKPAGDNIPVRCAEMRTRCR